MLTVFLTCVYLFFSMHICEHIKDEFPLLFAVVNKVFSDSDSDSEVRVRKLNSACRKCCFDK